MLADERVCTLVCTLGASLGFPKLPSVQNGLQDSRRVCLLIEILNDLVCLPSTCCRADGNVEMRKVEALLVDIGGTNTDRGNGLYSVVVGDRDMIYDHPHPRKEIGRGLAKRFREFFREVGIS